MWTKSRIRTLSVAFCATLMICLHAHAVVDSDMLFLARIDPDANPLFGRVIGLLQSEKIAVPEDGVVTPEAALSFSSVEHVYVSGKPDDGTLKVVFITWRGRNHHVAGLLYVSEVLEMYERGDATANVAVEKRPLQVGPLFLNLVSKIDDHWYRVITLGHKVEGQPFDEMNPAQSPIYNRIISNVQGQRIQHEENDFALLPERFMSASLDKKVHLWEQDGKPDMNLIFKTWESDEAWCGLLYSKNLLSPLGKNGAENLRVGEFAYLEVLGEYALLEYMGDQWYRVSVGEAAMSFALFSHIGPFTVKGSKDLRAILGHLAEVSVALFYTNPAKEDFYTAAVRGVKADSFTPSKAGVVDLPPDLSKTNYVSSMARPRTAVLHSESGRFWLFFRLISGSHRDPGEAGFLYVDSPLKQEDINEDDQGNEIVELNRETLVLMQKFDDHWYRVCTAGFRCRDELRSVESCKE